MGNIVNVSINDDAGNSNARVFSPDSTDGKTSRWSAKDTTLVAGRPYIQLVYSRATSQRKTDRVTYDIVVPIERLVDGETVVVHTARRRVEDIIPSELTQDERSLFGYLASRFGNHATFTDALHSGETPY